MATIRLLTEALILLAALGSAGCAGFALSGLLSSAERRVPPVSPSGRLSSPDSTASRYLEIKRRLEQFMTAE